jgi:hypothetical protein
LSSKRKPGAMSVSPIAACRKTRGVLRNSPIAREASLSDARRASIREGINSSRYVTVSSRTQDQTITVRDMRFFRPQDVVIGASGIYSLAFLALAALART